MGAQGQRIRRQADLLEEPRDHLHMHGLPTMGSTGHRDLLRREAEVRDTPIFNERERLEKFRSRAKEDRFCEISHPGPEPSGGIHDGEVHPMPGLHHGPTAEKNLSQW
jgi:hypothetical protein